MSKEANVETSLAATRQALQVSTDLEKKRSMRSSYSGGKVGSAIEALQTPNPTIQALTPAMSAGFKLLQSKIDNLATHSEMLMNALDGLMEIHPFVSVAVLAFKTAIKFEVTRRQNDKRILAVRVAMNDLFSVLLLLSKVGKDEPGQDGILIENRLAKRIMSIADDIKECTKVCDAFQSKRTVVRLFRSLEWEGKLEGLISTFEEHKKSLEFDMSMHASIRIEQVHTTLAVVSESVETTRDNTSMALLLQLLRSPEERDLRRFIDSKGGADQFLKNDELMQELIKKSGEPETKSDLKAASRKGQTDLVQEIKRDVNKTVADLIAENYEQFLGKFNAQQEQLRFQMEASVRREGDRIITAITGGPHERIQDLDLYNVWKDMGWKSTTKARNLVMALREYFSERRKDALYRNRQSMDHIRAILHSGGDSPSRKVQAIAEITEDGHHSVEEDVLDQAQDDWALDYITISRIQPLLEAFDDDASTLVSVAEVNAFTAARPNDWSLPQWMAFWTAGFPLTLKFYYTRIQMLLSRIGDRVRYVPPVNRPLMDAFVKQESITSAIDQFLAGVYNAVNDVYGDRELFERFQDYMKQEEERMQKMLHTLKYRIDAENTLRLVTGPGRLEKHVMPLLYLLFVRVYQVIGHAMTIAIHPQEVHNIVDSFEVIYDAIRSRAVSLKAVCKLQNLSPKEHLQKYSYGMFYYMEFVEDLPQSKYWKAMYINDSPRYFSIDGVADVEYFSPHWDVSEPSYADLDAINAIPPGEHFYSITDTLCLEAYDEPSTLADLLSEDGSATLSTWCGSYSFRGYDDTFIGKRPAGIIHLPLPEHDDQLSGSGTDTMGQFTLVGLLNGDSIVFNRQHTSDESSNKRRYEGKLSADRSQISGVWGPWDNVQDDFTKHLEPVDVQGQFDLRIAPLRLRSFVKLNSDLATSNPARARWHLALDIVRQLLRIKSGNFSWDYLQDRRRIRRRFLELYSRLNESGDATMITQTPVPLSIEEADELSTLVAYCSKQDLQFYRSLSACLQRRAIVHWGCYCDGETPGVLTGTRYLCLDCVRLDPVTGTASDTMDFCDKCINVPVDRIEDDMHHIPSHELLQLRYCAPRREYYPMEKRGLEAAKALRKDDTKGEIPRVCYRCKSSVERPYWYCLDCPENTCICMACKTELDIAYSPVLEMQQSRKSNTPTDGALIEATETSLVATSSAYPNDSTTDGSNEGEVSLMVAEAAPDEVGEAEGQANGNTQTSEQPSDDTKIQPALIEHLYTHTLILCQAFEKPCVDNSSKKPSVDEQLANLNERFDSLESKLEQIMGRLFSSVAVEGASSTTTIENP